jgi:hypothetical protein
LGRMMLSVWTSPGLRRVGLVIATQSEIDVPTQSPKKCVVYVLRHAHAFRMVWVVVWEWKALVPNNDYPWCRGRCSAAHALGGRLAIQYARQPEYAFWNQSPISTGRTT